MGGTEHVSDRELWRRAGEGDGEAFGVLFDRHREPVRAYCARRCGSLDAADDLVSVVFLEAWRRRADVELVHDSVLPWLYGVARRTVQRRTRTTLRHRRLLSRIATEQHGATGVPVTAEAAASHADHADGVAARIDDEAELRRLRSALSRLGRRDQEVLLLCVWQQLDTAAAAVALAVPVGTVKSRLSRARARLRHALDDGGPPGPAPERTHDPVTALLRSTVTAEETA
ncbi:RNA polymerase sigma factor [Aquipuribacter sp. SD81]|uniref:RNA polymerase sigma factor n=1 Tax=Aquipuribacter sp. SD81 TaxID=3127703 RepID=UPI0030188009